MSILLMTSYRYYFSLDTEADPFLQYAGFFPEQTASQTYTREYTITEPTEFYCSWYRGINFRFDANGGYFSGPDGTTVPVILKIGQSYNLLTYWSRDLIAPDSTKTLVGWSWDPDGNEPITDCAGFIPTEAMNGKTIYAVWGDGITVTYHSLNENVWFLDASGNKTYTTQASYSSGTVLDYYNISVRYYYDESSHWVFDRFYWDADGTNRVNEVITVTESIDLYCTFYEGVFIKMDANGGLFRGEQETVTYVFRLDTTLDFENDFQPDIVPPEPNLVLSGWSWKQNGSEPVTTVKMTKDVDDRTMYAIWGTGIQVTLHANLEGAYFTDSSGNHVSDLELTVKNGTTLNEILWRYPASAPVGSEWSDSYSRSTTPDGKALPNDTVLTDGMDLYVIWAKSVPLIFDAGDGTYGGQQVYQTSIRAGSYFSPDWYTAKPNQEGMAFLGWSLTNSKDDILHGRVYASDYEDGITLHAIYAPGHSLTIISNNPDGGKFGVYENGASYDELVSEATFLHAKGKELNYIGVSIATFDGYIFLGWSKTIDGEILDLDYAPDQEDTLYGIFVKGYEVYFDANGGTFDETLEETISYWLVEVPEGSPIGEVSVWHPSKTFVEWNTKPDGSGETIDPATYVPDRYLELYAIWSDDGSNVPVTGVSFANKSVTIKVGENKSCPATVAPANATNKKVTYKSSDNSIVTVVANGKITGKLVGKATITVTTADGNKKATMTVQVLFKDVADSSKYWYAPVYWAAEKGVTNGYQSASDQGTAKFGTFGAEENCLREQMITFLWRQAGKPEPTITSCPLKDAVKGKYYYKPILWAYEKGITKGYISGPNAGKFGVGLTVSREDTVTFINRMAKIYQKGFKDVTSTDLKNKDYQFKDVASGKYYQKPIVWAAKNNITKGYNSGEHKGKFGVGFNILRKDIVTFLYRYDKL